MVRLQQHKNRLERSGTTVADGYIVQHNSNRQATMLCICVGYYVTEPYNQSPPPHRQSAHS